MATVVQAFADERGSRLGRGLGTVLAQRQQRERKEQQQQQLAELFADPEKKQQDIVQAGLALGMDANDALKMGEAKRQANQRNVSEQALADMISASEGGATPLEIYQDVVRANPGMDPKLLGQLANSPLLQDSREEIEVFDESGRSAKIRAIKGTTPEVRRAEIEAQMPGFSLVDPSKLLERKAKARLAAGKAAKEDKPSVTEQIKLEEISSTLSDVGAPDDSIHRGRTTRYLKQKTSLEKAQELDHGVPREESFDTWTAPQRARMELQIARDLMAELFITGTKEDSRNARSRANLKAAEIMEDGTFLDRLGVNTSQASPDVMIKKMKTLDFEKEEVQEIMVEHINKFVPPDKVKAVMDLMLQDLEKAYPTSGRRGINIFDSEL